jgi:superfamily I DNA and/or RNA helicase
VIQNDQVVSLGVGSIFEKLINSGAPICFLDTQYRMHPQIGSIVSKNFYDSMLFNGVTA